MHNNDGCSPADVRPHRRYRGCHFRVGRYKLLGLRRDRDGSAEWFNYLWQQARSPRDEDELTFLFSRVVFSSGVSEATLQ